MQQLQDRRRRQSTRRRRVRPDDRTGRPGAALSCAKHVGLAGTVRAEPAQQRGAAFEAGQRIVVADLEAVREIGAGRALRAGGIGPQRIGGRENSAALRTSAGSRAPGLPSGRSLIRWPDRGSASRGPAPASSSTETMARSNSAARACVRDRGQRVRARKRPPSDRAPPTHEMPPARVKRDVQDRDRSRASPRRPNRRPRRAGRDRREIRQSRRQARAPASRARARARPRPRSSDERRLGSDPAYAPGAHG